MKKSISVFALFCLFYFAYADFSVDAVYSNNMVLQTGKKIVIRGSSDDNEKITVSFQGHTTEAARKGNRWIADLQSFPPGGPWTMVVSNGKKQIKFSDVLIGEVWFCSGQSNMVWSVRNSNNPKEEIADSCNYPEVRIFKTPRRLHMNGPIRDLNGAWEKLSSRTVTHFSAIAYGFARKLNRDLKVPIGVIDSSWGGSPIETWISVDDLVKYHCRKALEKRKNQMMNSNIPKEKREEEFQKKFLTWVKLFLEYDPVASKNAENWKFPDYNDSEWEKCELPGEITFSEINRTDGSFRDLDGIRWIRKTFNVPEIYAKEGAILKLGCVDDCDETYLNGQKIGETLAETPDYWRRKRDYRIPAGLLKTGKNTIAIRIQDLAAGMFLRHYLKIEWPDKTQIDLAGSWKVRTEFALNEKCIPPRPEPLVTTGMPTPGTLYNTMVFPWKTYPIRGILWYQGESNVGEAEEYVNLFSVLIRSWRTHWNDPTLPFLFAQISALGRGNTDSSGFRLAPREDSWAELREAQESALSLPKTRMVVTIDVGDPKDIHPKNKKEVARRFALEAEDLVYGKKIPSSSPLYEKHEIENGTVRIFFRNTGRGLAVKNNKTLTEFSIAGKDGKFVWANAKIEGNCVVVSSPQISDPNAVRYCWVTYPEEPFLMTKDGLPAAPFRTDRPYYLNSNSFFQKLFNLFK